MISERHAMALAYAARDVPVFPCLVDRKQPATENGFKDRTTSTEQINAWWSVADYNLAIVPEDMGCFVVDIDCKNDGILTWQSLVMDKPNPPTRSIITPSGGFHFYFYGSAPPSCGRLGPGVDIRGRNSYVLVPPSIVNGMVYREQ